MNQEVFVATGLASRRPVAAFRDLYVLQAWLRRRRGTDMLLVTKMNGERDAIVLCVHCLLDGLETRSGH